MRVSFGFWVLVALLALPSFGQAARYTASDSTEAMFAFRHRVEFAFPGEPSEAAARTQIDKQLRHFFGPMAAEKYPAVPSMNYAISEIELVKLGSGRFSVKYAFRGKMVVRKGVEGAYPVTLPLDPNTIYETSVVKGVLKQKHPCTGNEHTSKDEFWYYWDPENRGCKLRAGEDYHRILAHMARLANTTKSYPEYDRLSDSHGEILITLFYGMRDPDSSPNPADSDDLNARNYREVRSTLLESGWKARLLTVSETQSLLEEGDTLPHVEELTREGTRARLRLQMFYGITDVNRKASSSFHAYLKEALKSSAIVLYGGQSGLGRNLNLEAIEAKGKHVFEPNLDRYQIYFFNSGSSYAHFNAQYFARKVTGADPKGTKNLDILTNALANPFSDVAPSTLAFLQAVSGWARGEQGVSYQAIAQRTESGSLFGINGDEDNPKSY